MRPEAMALGHYLEKMCNSILKKLVINIRRTLTIFCYLLGGTHPEIWIGNNSEILTTGAMDICRATNHASYKVCHQCEVVEECFEELKQVVQGMIERDVTNKEILCYGYNHRNKKRLSIVIWAATKVLFRIYMERNFNKKQIWIELVKEMEWNLNREYKIGAVIELTKLRSLVYEKKLIQDRK